MVLRLLDSIAEATAADAGRILVTGSHGGRSAGAYALAVRPHAAIFNDAGVGKDGAGIAALAMLEADGIAAATVSHASARIGEAAETLGQGRISHINATAGRYGLVPGETVASAIRKLEAGLAESGPT